MNNSRAKISLVLSVTITLTCCLYHAAAQAGDLHVLIRDKAGKEVADAVVVALPLNKPRNSKTNTMIRTVTVDQVNKEFTPYVLAVEVGTSVSFPNKDNIRHHVYSFSPAKVFERPLYAGNAAAPVIFDTPGVVTLGCNIHDWMISYIYVTESPYFFKTGVDGKAILSNLPSGNYNIRIWHPRLRGKEEPTEKMITVPDSGVVEYSEAIELKPDFRIRRAPIPGRGGY